MTPSRTDMPMRWHSSSPKPAALATRRLISSARPTLSRAVSRVISIRLVCGVIRGRGPSGKTSLGPIFRTVSAPWDSRRKELLLTLPPGLTASHVCVTWRPRRSQWNKPIRTGANRGVLARANAQHLGPISAVEAAVLDGFAQVVGLDARRAVQIGYGARDFQDAVVRAGGKPQARNGVFEQFLAFRRNRAVFSNEFRRHLRVGVHFFLLRVTLQLRLPRPYHALPHAVRVFRHMLASQFLVLHRGDFDVDVNTVQQRTGDFRDVALDQRRCAMAFARRVSEKTAGTRIHRGGQHEA